MQGCFFIIFLADKYVKGPFQNLLPFLFFQGTPPSCLKVMGGWLSWLYSGTAGYMVVAHKILVSDPVPLELTGLDWV